MIDRDLFNFWVWAASMAPSSDNMQPWFFQLDGDSVDVYLTPSRLLAIDVDNMFSWISLGGAMENMRIAAAASRYSSELEYCFNGDFNQPAARLTFRKEASVKEHGKLVDQIPLRTTNRRAFHDIPLELEVLDRLSSVNQGLDSQICCITQKGELERLIAVDEDFSQVLLDHKPLFDGLFDTIRFSKREMEKYRCGMDVKSLDIPFLAALFAKTFRKLELNRYISRWGFGPSIARQLSARLKKAGAVLLIHSKDRNPRGFMEAGRSMSRLWLQAQKLGLSVHPYGVIPQYFAMAELQPQSFLPHHVETILDHRKSYHEIFSLEEGAQPMLMLRLGKCTKQSHRTTIRFKPEQISRIT